MSRLNEEQRRFWSSGWRQRNLRYTTLGVTQQRRLPETVAPVQVMGVWVRVASKTDVCVNAKARKPHRLLATCPDCGVEMSAGRLHQHLGTAECAKLAALPDEFPDHCEECGASCFHELHCSKHPRAGELKPDHGGPQ